MFTILLTRQGPIHIVNYYTNRTYLTICGKNYHKSVKLNTLSADNTFQGICHNCKHYYDEMYQSNLGHHPQDARGASIFTEDVISLHRDNFIGPKARHLSLVEYRYSVKINKYRRLIVRDRIRIKNGK